MSNKSGSNEEKFPLLFLFLEDGQRTSKQYRNISFDKGRYQGIASGASNIVTQWPGHITSSWITGTLIGISIFLITMLMLSFTIYPGIQNLTSKCKNNYGGLKMKEPSIIYLVHDQTPWINTQLDVLKEIAQNNPKANIVLIMIKNEIDTFIKINETKSVPYINTIERRLIPPKKILTKREVGASPISTFKNERRKVTINKINKITTQSSRTASPQPKKTVKLNVNVDTKELLNMLLQRSQKANTKLENTTKKVVRQIQTFEEVLNYYPLIQVVNTTYEKVFRQTPLYLYWQNTNIDTRLFAIRVLQLWNFGGRSFALPIRNKTSKITEYVNFANFNSMSTPFPGFSKYKNGIKVGISSAKNLPAGLVTIDDEGLYMETKTVCHAFFGEVLVALSKVNINTKPSDVIKKVLHHFCLKGAVAGDYCKTVT